VTPGEPACQGGDGTDFFVLQVAFSGVSNPFVIEKEAFITDSLVGST